MGEQQNPVPDCHLVGKRPIVALILGQRTLRNGEEVRHVRGKVKADVTSGKALDRMTQLLPEILPDATAFANTPYILLRRDFDGGLV